MMDEVSSYLVLSVVGSSVGGALLVPLSGIQLITDPIVTTIVHSTFVALMFCGCDAN